LGEGTKVADKAAEKVMSKRATCLRDMELKIQAWGFIAAVKKPGDDLAHLENWQPNNEYEKESEFIASLRDDILLLKRLLRGATITVGSIEAAPRLSDMPTATPYPASSVAAQ
jgi:hypothetical protein